MKVYHITICFDKEKEQWEYICEEEEYLEGSEDYEDMKTRGYVDLSEYFDEEGLELITGCYIMGEA